MNADGAKEKAKEIRTWIRARAKEIGLPGKGKAYNDGHKKSRSLKVGVAPGHPRKNREPNPHLAAHDKLLTQLVKETQEKFGKFLLEPAEKIQVRKGCCIVCSGSDMGVKVRIKIDEG